MNRKSAFLQETKALKIVGGHKNIVLFYGVTDLNKTPSLVQSYESEGSLKQYLRLWEKML